MQVMTPGSPASSPLQSRRALVRLPEPSLDQEKQLPFTLNGHLSINKDYHVEW
jgi:hypothetical protein